MGSSKAETGPSAAVRVRPDLVRASPYVPGESLPEAVKLSSNELGFAPLPGVLEAIARASSQPNRYPDNSAVVLRSALAEYWGVDRGQVVVGCGSSLLCQELVQATCAPGDVVAFGWRSFEAYRLYAQTAHAKVLTVPNRADGALDLEALAHAICTSPDPVGVVFLCTPNNPTGATIDGRDLNRFLDAIPSSIPVVLDEAYREFADDGSLEAIGLHRSGRRNVVALRTFSKAYGLAGLRVGYAIAAPEIVNAVHVVRSPFSVTAAAQAGAVASLAAQDELRDRVAVVRSERERVREALLNLGVPVLESQANFVWLPLGDQAEAFGDHCRAHRVLVRSFHPEGVRVSISTASDNDQFIAAARSWARPTETTANAEAL